MDNLKKLPGFRDLAQGKRLNLNRAYTVLSDIFSSYGYDAIDTPFLEPTEMFLRKGGGEMASQIYSFVDPGGNPVSLRPEFTSSILRWCLEEDRLAMLPLRVQYGGPVSDTAGKVTNIVNFTRPASNSSGPPTRGPTPRL